MTPLQAKRMLAAQEQKKREAIARAIERAKGRDADDGDSTADRVRAAFLDAMRPEEPAQADTRQRLSERGRERLRALRRRQEREARDLISSVRVLTERGAITQEEIEERKHRLIRNHQFQEDVLRADDAGFVERRRADREKEQRWKKSAAGQEILRRREERDARDLRRANVLAVGLREALVSGHILEGSEEPADGDD